MKKIISKYKRCLTITVTATGILIGNFVPWQSGFSQDTTFWRPDMIRIAKPSSQPGWIDLKEELKLNPETIFIQNKSAFGINKESEMRLVKTSTDLMGNKHYLYQQYYKGLPVEGGEYIIHEKKGIAVGANGKILNKLPIDATAIITEQSALAQALSYLNADEYYWQNKQHEQFLKAETKNNNATNYPRGELVFAYIDLGGKEKSKNVLAYKFTIRTSKPKDESRLIYVDAKNKTVIRDVDLDPNCSGTNIHTNFNETQQIYTYTNSFMSGWDMEDDCSPTTIKVYDVNNSNNIFHDGDNNWTIPYELSAGSSLWAIKRSLDIYGVYFGRNGWNNQNGNIAIYQGWNFGTPSKPNYNNAEFRLDGECHVGLGKNQNGGQNSVKDDWNTLDIMGHEFSHGVSGSQTGWQNNYSAETGALNEAFSDVMGETIEFYVTGTPNDWLMGQQRTGGAIRSLSNPGVNPFFLPDTYYGSNWVLTAICIPNNDPNSPGYNDNCGVHSNCGPMDYAFYLLSDGGNGWNNGQTSHAPAGSGFNYNVSGIGIIAASHIFYDALVYLTSTAQYDDMRNATLHAAIDMYGSDCANEVIQLAEAWRAVGVGKQSPFYNNQVCNPVISTYFEGSSTVIGGGNCATDIAGSVPVQFEARDSVLLRPGFTAKTGSNFRANINPCTITAYKSSSVTTFVTPVQGISKSISAVPKINNEFSAKLLTNPVKDQLKFTVNVKNQQSAQVTIADMAGRVLRSEKQILSPGINMLSYDIKAWAKGMYMITIVTADGSSALLKAMK